MCPRGSFGQLSIISKEKLLKFETFKFTRVSGYLRKRCNILIFMLNIFVLAFLLKFSYDLSQNIKKNLLLPVVSYSQVTG